MMKRLLMLGGVGVGYVLGARAGRERYDQIMRVAGRVKDDPRVQEKAQQAADMAREQAPIVKDKLSEAASATADKARSATHRGPDPAVGDDQLHPKSTHFQDDPYPKGDLP